MCLHRIQPELQWEWMDDGAQIKKTCSFITYKIISLTLEIGNK